ncbi:type I polyketide synthase [Lipingzhangella sp. LS1_29]|uniref:Type I polyketide synthase n=1 Tax=Lipingzhangella rawalii TaxID=2055835 RepID=A0ABU2H6J4_9ACTN|nr:type I polyketide synthase [Lipingzhangella rawalii]MDS1270910.1 type I polyketide synthase [Lipingzhangella rawalii]
MSAEDIAIVGVDGRFPGASTVEELWELLISGDDAIDQVPADRWDAAAFHHPEGSPGHANTVAGGFIADADAFDHEFFGISPREAAAMDPQQRLLVQAAWRALEDAGCDPRSQAGTNTGVLVGVMGNEWAHLHMTDYARITPHVGSGNGYCMIANKVSYHLDLKGPSWAVDTACSSSLVAVHQACVALRGGECDQVIVGGVNIMVTPALTIFYTQAGLSAPDGACKPFSRHANGIVRGEAVGAVVLRRLSDALADGLPVRAVIRGSAINQDGRSNGVTAPSRWSQREVIAEAYRRADVHPRDVAAVEAHGTGTVLGDMIEATALGQVHGVARAKPCAVGSVKANLGHTEGAAGITALIKMALAIDRGVLPPHRHARDENPQLKLSEKGLRLLRAPTRLHGDDAVGVSSFGLGGTNVHLVLGRGPAQLTGTVPDDAADGVITVSANNRQGLARNAARLADAVELAGQRELGQLCWTTNQTKASGRVRYAVVASDRTEAAAVLREAGRIGQTIERGRGDSGRTPSLGWLFSGQGSQYPGMTAPLHRRCAAYRQALGEADEALGPVLGESISQRMLADDPDIHDTGLAQPAILAAGYALGRTLEDAGLRPDWMLGHSVGEFAVAVLAGALNLTDAARLVCVRARLMQELPTNGGMLAVRGPVDRLESLLAEEPDTVIAGFNGPQDLVCSGPLAALERVAERLDREGVRTARLRVSHAFHSPLMDPVLEEFRSAAAQCTFHPAQRDVYSTLHGRKLAPGELMDASYWTEHIRSPVLFADAAAQAMQRDPTHLVEVGSTVVLGPLVRRLADGGQAAVLSPCPGPRATGTELLDVVARLYQDGLNPRWAALYAPELRLLRRLPPYDFATEFRYWTTSPTPEDQPRASTASPPTSEASTPRTPADALGAAVVAAVAELCGCAPHQVRDDALLHEDLGFDSIMLVQLKEQLEKITNHPIDIQELAAEVTTPADVRRFLQDQQDRQDGQAPSEISQR